MPTVACLTRVLYKKENINIDTLGFIVFSKVCLEPHPRMGLFSCSNAISHLPPYNYAWNLFEAIRRRI